MQCKRDGVVGRLLCEGLQLARRSSSIGSEADAEAEADADAVSSLSSPSTPSVRSKQLCPRERHRYYNRVLMDWNGEQFRHRKGNTSADFSDLARVRRQNSNPFLCPLYVC